MIFKQFRSIRPALCVVLIATSSVAIATTTTDKALLEAYDAYGAGDAMKLGKYAKQLEGTLLEPWSDYWQLSLTLEDASPSEVQAFFDEHRGTYASELLRADWLKVLGKRAAWADFDRGAAQFRRPDLEIRCYELESRIARGEEQAFAEAAALWLGEPAELPEGCQPLAATLVERGVVSVDDIWRRVRVLFENGRITAAKTVLGYLPADENPDERALADAVRRPQRLIKRLPKNMARRAVREVRVLAAIRYARSDPAAMAEALDGEFGEHLPERERQYLWTRVAYSGAHLHLDQALDWYARAGNAQLSDPLLAWKARAALRAADWMAVREAIDRMSARMREDPAWTYWYGRALAAQGEETGARAYYLRIAGQTDFYGLLATEELGYVATLPQAPAYVPSEEDVAAAARVPGFERALDLIRLGLRTEGVREWLYTLRGLDDRHLLAAAELARRAEVYDRAIQAADRTKRVHNFTLRYPVPFRDVFEEYAKSQGLDEAWVFALVRQESRFVADARSSAGAAGLMQIMPRTARYVAEKIGLRHYHPRKVTDVPTNVNLGTGYLRLVLEKLGSPVLASAAYNAGPTRAERWRDTRPMEGAIYVETIPFGETRDYVKKVTASALFYAALLEGRVTPIKARLGIIAPRDAGDSAQAGGDDLP
jgi:soluble lytic murein transglycosylase